MASRHPFRYPLMGLGMVALLLGLWGGLLRLGWGVPVMRPTLPGAHGPLMVSGFLGTLIGLERAVVLGQLWTYGGPLLTGLGALVLIAGLPGPLGPLLMAFGSLGLAVVFAVIVRRRPGLSESIMGLGAVAWLVGNILWLAGWPIYSVVPWWTGFLVFTIAGERLELSRFVPLSGRDRMAFLAAIALFVVGLLLSEVAFDVGSRLNGLGLLALSFWLLRHDMARRAVRGEGLTRFVAVSLLSGYFWLGVAGLLGVGMGGLAAGSHYDAWLHAIFLGFVFSMIFGHAPIIFPAVLGIAIPYRPVFYAHLALLHASLMLRVGGDLAGWWPGRQWGGLLNVVAVLLFLGNTALSGVRGKLREPAVVSGGQTVQIARLPIHFFAVAVAFFALAVAAAPWIIGDLIDYFYQPLVLALTHTFTLGWISSAMMGVMYRYVPALTKRPLRFPRLALVQLWLFVIGVMGMVTHFAIGRWIATWLAAGVVVVSVALFALNMLLCLAPVVSRRGVAETGMLLAILYLLAAAVLGLLLGLDKTFDFLGGNVVRNLAGHAHLAALGWVSLTICAVSYRMVPAFLLPEVELPRAAMWQLYGLAVAVAGLGISLMGGIGRVPVWSVIVVMALLAYVGVLGSLVRHRRMSIDWTMRHALAGVVCLVLAAGLGLSLILIAPDSAVGNGIAGAYGVVGLLGWVTNFIIGMSYKLFPGFIAGLREIAGWPRLAITELSLPRYRPFVFFLLNVGVLAVALGLITAQVALARLGTVAIAVGGLVYVTVMAWTLSYAYRPSVPRAASDPLRILR